MTLIVVLIALVLQRFLKFNSYSRQIDWASPYFAWVSSKVKYITTGHGLLSLAILILPLLIVSAIIFWLGYVLLGYLGSGILQVILVWYCLDARDARKEPYANPASETLLLQSYRHLFAVLFWYCLLGPIALILYVSVSQLLAVIPKGLPLSGSEVEEQSLEPLRVCFTKTQQVLDWVPVRLLGLTFALVGNFSVVFKLWTQQLFEVATPPVVLVNEWGQAALKAEPAEAAQLESAIHLIDRSLLVWLVVVFLVTISVFFG